MSFFSEASLAMIPSGYKTSKVYSAVPTTGDGDLTFSRSNDTATRVGPDGLIEKVRTNVLLQSNTFSTTWTPSNVSVTGGQAGYDGSSDAWLINITGGTSSQRVNQTISASGVLTLSVYAKAGTLNWISVRSDAPAVSEAYFNLATGTLGSLVGLAIHSSIESVGSGWYRCSVSFVDTTIVRIYLASGDGNVNQSSGNIYLQDAMLESGDIATDYIETTTAAVSVGPVANVPRLDYLNSSCPRLLLEPTATALNNFSEQLDNAYWTGSAVVTANTDISPDGYQNADTLNDNTTSFLDKRRVITITPNAAHTFSFFVKKTSGALTHYAGMAALLTGGTTRVDYGIINTTTGEINRDASSNINSVSYSSVSYGDYWRVIMTFTDNQSNTTCTIIAYPAISTNGTSINQNAQGSNVFWGLNLTQSSYATSYIPTLGAAVTRGADACSKAGISSLIGQTEGTMYWEGVRPEGGNETSAVSLSDGSTNNEVTFRFTAVDTVEFYVRSGGGQTVASTYTGADLNQNTKIAFAYKANDVAIYVNGTAVVLDNTVTLPTSLTAFKFSRGNDGTPMIASVSQALLFPTRLSNADLAALTA